MEGGDVLFIGHPRAGFTLKLDHKKTGTCTCTKYAECKPQVLPGLEPVKQVPSQRLSLLIKRKLIISKK